MARFNVTAPDGSIIPVDAPAGATEQDAIAFAASTWKPAAGKTGAVATGPSAIPTEPGANLAPTAAPQQTFGQRMMGYVEAPFAVGASVLSGLPTYLAGAGGPEFQQQVAKQIQYEPRTPQAQQAVETMARGLEATKIPPFLSGGFGALAPTALPAARAIADVGRAEGALVKSAVKAPLEARAARIQEGRVAQSYANAPVIDATQAAQRIGGAVPPAISNPTLPNVIKGKLVGPELEQKLVKQNEVAVTNAVRKDLGVKPSEKIIPELDEVTGKLNPNSPITRALDEASKPYEPIRQMQSLATPKESIDALTGLKRQPTIGGEAETAAINSVVDDALAKLQRTTTGPFSGVGGGPVAVGRSGAAVLDDIRSLRRNAQATYRAQKINPDPLATAKADTQMAIANILEDVIDANASSPKMLSDLKTARTKLAQIYQHERALNYGQQKFDPQVYAKMFEERKGGMSGVGADIAQAAATFPDYFTLTPVELKGMPRLTRTGIGGAIGGALGAPLGPLGFVAGTSAGMGVGSLSGSLAARRMATPAYQAAHAMPQDFRPTVNALRPVEPNVTPNALVPYDYSQQAYSGYTPNFTVTREQYGPQVTTPGFAPGPAQLPAPSAEGTMNMLRAEQQRAAGMSRTLGQQAEAQQAAAEAAARRPAGRGVELMVDEAGNLVPAPAAGAGGVVGAPSALESAVQKMSGQVIEQPSTSYKTMTISPKSGAQPYTRVIKREGETTFERGVPQAFNMTAEEKIAWNKAKANLAEVMPGMRALNDKAVAAKLMDREWIQQAVTKSKEKAKLLDDIIARSDNERLRQDAKIEREKLQGSLEMLDERFRQARPVKTGGQGPKTRAFQRNMLRPDDGEIQNALVK